MPDGCRSASTSATARPRRRRCTCCQAVAVAEVDGPGVALALVDDLDLVRFPLYHAVRADLLDRLGRREEATAAYTTAIEPTRNAAERALLERSGPQRAAGEST